MYLPKPLNTKENKGILKLKKKKTKDEEKMRYLCVVITCIHVPVNWSPDLC